jgi:hypothetical protein
MQATTIAALAISLALAAPARGSTVFDFDELPDSSGCKPPVDVAACEDYMNQSSAGELTSAFTTVDGIRLDIGVESAAFDWFVGADGFLSAPGNQDDAGAFVATFSKPLGAAQVDVRLRDFAEGGSIEWLEPVVYLEAFGAAGNLLGRVEASGSVEAFTTLRIGATPTDPIRSLRFAGAGRALRSDPGRPPFEQQMSNASWVDDLEVRPIPEPGGAALFALGVALALRSIGRAGAETSRRV